MLPDINTDDGSEREERILVSRGSNLELFGGMVIALMVPNQSRHLNDCQLGALRTSQPQPEPWIPAVVVLKSATKAS